MFFKVLGIVVLFLLALFMVTYIDFSRADEPAASGSGTLAESNPPPVGGAFTLTGDKGEIVTEKSLLGRYTLIFFGYTHCPDACPTMLSTLAEVSDRLTPGKRVKLHVVFVSIDPDRDTPKALGEYVRSFNTAFSGWTGTKAQLDDMTKKYLAYYGITKDAEGNPQISHSDLLYLMGPDGRYMAHFRHADSAASIAAKLSAAIR